MFESVHSGKSRPGVLAFWMLALGFLAAGGAAKVVGLWSAIGPGLKVCYVLLLAGGAALFTSGAWLLITGGRSRAPLWSGAAAASLAGGTTLVGLLANVIPCAGPV